MTLNLIACRPTMAFRILAIYLFTCYFSLVSLLALSAAAFTKKAVLCRISVGKALYL